MLIFGKMRKIKYLTVARVRYLIGSSLEKILVSTEFYVLLTCISVHFL